MGQEKYEVWFAGIRGLGARKKYLLHEALKSCRNAYYIEETQIEKIPFSDRKRTVRKSGRHKEERSGESLRGNEEKRNPYNPVLFRKISPKITSACGLSICIIRERKTSGKRY